MAPKSHDDFWGNYFKLALQIWQEVLLFLWQWITIVWWSILNDIGNKNIAPLQSNTSEHFIQKFTGRPDKWEPLLVFSFTWCFTDKYDICVRITITDYKVLGCLSQIWADIVFENICLNLVKKLLLVRTTTPFSKTRM